MEKLIIEGGRPLAGTVKVSGSKNAALPIMAATLLATGEHRLEGVPNLRDIRTMARLIEHIGAEVTPHSGSADGWQQGWDGSLCLKVNRFNGVEAPYDLVKTMRASVLIMGPLVGQLRRARVSLPGGCAIGARPIDMHLKALEAMGAKIELKEGYVEVFARHLRGAEITFNKVTVTGTENIMMAAVLADGVTVIQNAAREPEVADLARHLKSMGAKIEGAGTDRITIRGVDSLSPAPHRIIPDRIEAGTLLMAAGITGGELVVENFPADMLETLIARLADAGMSIDVDGDRASAFSSGRLKGIDVTTAPHPGFATDLQAQFMAMMSVAGGTSIITETIFENRFMHVPELTRMGAQISTDGGTAIIKGVPGLKGAPVMATDLRASASLVLAGLAAEGNTEVRRIYHLDRGYERIEEKLAACGARIRREPDEQA
ncbi:MAG: UDP-N-acetylglucosamine 1-carboxyvinyltransferase [Proteobacteria bacterium]|nr:UDP-N-acetylglucosamine 1-carboxyvinyltransferase [Pseudomonadota bacterium]